LFRLIYSARGGGTRPPEANGYQAVIGGYRAILGGKRSRRNLGLGIWAILRSQNREPTGETMKKAHRKGQLRKKRRKLELRRQQIASRKAPKA
jgi:hypothetical protein